MTFCGKEPRRNGERGLFKKSRRELSAVRGDVACPTRFERAAYRVGVCRSIQLGYGHIFCYA